VYTYSAVSQEVAEKSGLAAKLHLHIKNPLSSEHEYMRRSLAPSHAEVLNNNKTIRPLSVFEFAHVYHPKEKDLPDEQYVLCLTTNDSFRVLRGAVEAVLSLLHIPQNTVTYDQEENQLTVTVQDIDVAICTAGDDFSTATLDWKSLLHFRQKEVPFTPVSKYMPITEDLTFLVPETVQVGSVLHGLHTIHDLVQSVTVGSLYKSNVTFHVTYFSPTSQLSSIEIEPIRKQIVEHVQKTYGLTLVGSLV
jgi:phenylalanyl-tRNA synthetase beta subunit